MNGELLTWDVWGNPQIIEQDEKPQLDEVIAKIDELLESEYRVRSQTVDPGVKREVSASIRVLLELKEFINGQ